jgi:DNA-binding phage protein
MTRKININDLPDFDVTDYLDEVVAVSQYLAIVMADGDPVLLEAALGDIARMSHRTSSLKPPASSV